MRLNEFLPSHEFREIHSVIINASPERTFVAIKELTVADLSPLILLMFNIRWLPAKLLKKDAPGAFRDGPFLGQLLQSGFIPLAEEPNCEIVFGLVGQFWKLNGGDVPHIPDAAAFLTFDDPAFAKVVANLAVGVDRQGRTRCSTETRIHVPEPSTRRKFALYWRISSMGSAFIRVLWLRAIKRKAEKA